MSHSHSSRVGFAEPPSAAVKRLRQLLGDDVVSTRELDRAAAAVDASHYLRVPDAVLRARSSDDVRVAMMVAVECGWPLTLRAGGTSLSGQAQAAGLAVDVRRHFRGIEVLDEGARVRVQPGATIREVNTVLGRMGQKLGPDPASEIACTVGGMIANNSSGMTCGTVANAYRTVESMTIVLPSGTIVDTAASDADDQLARSEPALVKLLSSLRDVLRSERFRGDIQRRFAIKNTMGYGINSFLDHDRPVKILEHLMVGSEGTLGFVAEAVFRTVPVPARTATGLLVFDSLNDATEALPVLADSGAAVVELIDAASIRAMGEAARDVLPARFRVSRHASLLVEYHAGTDTGIEEAIGKGTAAFEGLTGVSAQPELTQDSARRARMWVVRKGLYTKVARNRPAGTAALLEDVAVPMLRLGGVCSGLHELFDRYGYEDAVIFGHAKDGNIHFLVTEDFDGEAALKRYENFTEDMVELVLSAQGTLKAEHGTGRIMAPFVRRQYGDSLYAAMWQIKNACDPAGILNPGAVLTEDPRLHLKDIKPTPPVRQLFDDCVECGYCEPVCPSQHLTTTPRQRIVIQRAIAAAEQAGEPAVAERLRSQQTYDVIQTCAVDGMCETACPVQINTGDLVRTLRREERSRAVDGAWKVAADHWAEVVNIASLGMTVANKLPAPLVRAPLKAVRAAIGDDMIPMLSAELPGGGPRRRVARHDQPDAIFMPACVGTMFGSGHACGDGVAGAVRKLAVAAGLTLSTPDGIETLCCGTPWKSKGLPAGYDVMRDRLVAWVIEHTRAGELPLVCDNASCTEGVIVALRTAGAQPVRVLDATEWVVENVVPRLPTLQRTARAVVHPTCSSTHLDINRHLTLLAGLVADEVVVPNGWRCCGFAGDRGLLHEELTASATRDQAAAVERLDADLHLSCNRTCELALTRATGRIYTHVLEELAARVALE
ncbi:FAD-binding and (Fe-S)-binding domain-containing protein [Tessaracoccus lubricantis]|uniref:D-lactate dehydrogenase (cytochrome) n=1 Tax=Tessaracoccus lubricantis TaxID=545543 RepID=A0ABP9F5P9_9ACTN